MTKSSEYLRKSYRNRLQYSKHSKHANGADMNLNNNETIIKASNDKLAYAMFKLKKAYAYDITNLFQATHRLGRIEDAHKAIEDALDYQKIYNSNRS